jgi:hypothetical protein
MRLLSGNSHERDGGLERATSGDGPVAVGIPMRLPTGNSHDLLWPRAGATAGITVSVLGNMLHSLIRPDSAGPGWSPQPGQVFGALWWPLALFLALEVFASKVWGGGAWWWLLRIAATAPVAAVAAVVSYRHLSGLLAHWGEDGFTVAFGPVAVDGLMLLCAAALYRARALTDPVRSAHRVAQGGAHREVPEPPRVAQVVHLHTAPDVHIGPADGAVHRAHDGAPGSARTVQPARPVRRGRNADVVPPNWRICDHENGDGCGKTLHRNTVRKHRENRDRTAAGEA